MVASGRLWCCSGQLQRRAASFLRSNTRVHSELWPPLHPWACKGRLSTVGTAAGAIHAISSLLRLWRRCWALLTYRYLHLRCTERTEPPGALHLLRPPCISDQIRPAPSPDAATTFAQCPFSTRRAHSASQGHASPLFLSSFLSIHTAKRSEPNRVVRKLSGRTGISSGQASPCRS